ncbi:NUDIX hydrolase [Propionibacteriaceae bacterium G1746]|uniref:NUDIX hydrolase n=1 Tax=Aestuariimicrobium sp. G57 TaxID=3418485 RepID=UPI003C249072
MQIVGVATPGSHELVRVEVEHGQHPKLAFWRQGWMIQGLLSAQLVGGEVVLTARVVPRTSRMRPPRVKLRGADPDLVIARDEIPVQNQRIAAYAVVRSPLGVLGTECSDRTAVPGLWQLPGGGLDPLESPADAVVREVLEEAGQQIRINKLLDLQSDHWIGRAPNGVLEDFHALRIFYSATCMAPTEPVVLDVDGTTERSEWVPLWQWRSLPWTSGSRSILDKFAAAVPAH